MEDSDSRSPQGTSNIEKNKRGNKKNIYRRKNNNNRTKNETSNEDSNSSLNKPNSRTNSRSRSRNRPRNSNGNRQSRNDEKSNVDISESNHERSNSNGNNSNRSNNRSRNSRRKNDNYDKSNSRSNSNFKSYQPRDKLSAERLKILGDNQNKINKELEICSRVLGSKSFKLFKKNSDSISYGYTIHNINISDISKFKILVEIPNEYPNKPINLSLNNKSIVTMSRTMEISNEDSKFQKQVAYLQKSIRNFNFKVLELQLANEPILAQLNYFVQNLDILMNSNYKNISEISKTFYNQFI
ncbi:hypothetical protein TBLA_0E01840 [Henningerozyma blattae CBS 6284]|uniref:RWD domain-containing protein n=1 Tax=Henningerozyma blattae (strain ATCC 34711 / CBS 6284 / DSM 70876 / NBRC 10599 / NRRL Y-10934 / UCD 77-7) TaxID=1071380 RepID=I2H4D6_HENB6|nr:hypothetical protein TBLA_0E01840 [Tetrapisispora blattae CBS 6284]CCH61238.1 hypothetical protein TBLA_0E01840 [Tetrapisispora blattae CBS 6284]